MNNVIYITGRGGDASEGLGAYIESHADKYVGISLNPLFLKQDFQLQVQEIRATLVKCEGFDVVANSYGAYLLLHSLIGFEGNLSSVKLLSPVLGKGISKTKMFSSRPPSVKTLMNSLSEETLKCPKSTFIYIGDEDMGYCPELKQLYADYLGESNIYVLQGEKHNLSKKTVKSILGYED